MLPKVDNDKPQHQKHTTRLVFYDITVRLWLETIVDRTLVYLSEFRPIHPTVFLEVAVGILHIQAVRIGLESTTSIHSTYLAVLYKETQFHHIFLLAISFERHYNNF